ncbi:MAG: dehydrogenase [Candidatus Hydrogenedentota bacterium]
MPLLKSSRRQFLSTASKLAAAVVAPNIVPSGVLAAEDRPGPNDRINIGYIGVGRRASQLMGVPPDTRIVAYCDVNRSRLEKLGAKNKDAKLFTDYRELLQSPDIDAVIVATPDHWHALPVIQACEAGKDVYCEKPLSLTINEGKAMVAAARKHGRVVQTGSQQRSMPECLQGIEFIREGAIGTIHTVNCANYPSPWDCDLPEQPVPEGLNWDMWCGPTEPRGYHDDLYLPRAENRKYPDGRPLGWISYTPYSGGEMTGWGAHGLDIVLWALDQKGPVEVWTEPDAPSGPPVFFGKTLQFEDPDAWPEGKKLTCPVVFRFAGGVTVKLNGKGGGGGGVFEGDAGQLMIDRAQYDLRRRGAQPELTKPGPDTTMPHIANWCECIRTRAKPCADIEIGHRAAVLCHLGNIARWANRTLKWNPDKEEFVDDAEANKYLERPMRAPWQLTA